MIEKISVVRKGRETGRRGGGGGGEGGKDERWLTRQREQEVAGTMESCLTITQRNSHDTVM